MNRMAFAILSGTMFLSMIGFGLIVPLLPVYARDFGASSVEVGMLFSVTAMANLVMLPVIGPWSDRHGRVMFMCIGLLIMSIGTLGLWAADSVAMLLLCRALQGVSMSMHLPVAQAMLGDMVPTGQEGRWMGYFNAIMFSGLGAGPLIGGYASDLIGVEQVFLVSGGVMFLALIATAAYLRDPQRKQKERPGHAWSWSLLRNPVVCGISCLQACMGVLTGLSMAFLPVLASESLALGATAIGLVLFVRTPISALQSWSGKLADTHSRKVQIALGIVMASSAIIAMPLVSGVMGLLLANAILALGAVLVQPASSAYMVEQGRTLGMGFAMSLIFMAMQVGGGFGPVAAGWIMEQGGLAVGFYAAGALNMLGLVVFLWLMRGVSHRSALPADASI